jgi:adenylyltransferase/sulfurtransferase
MNDLPERIDRYARQRTLPQIGDAGQTRLANSRILLVGCGALGSNLAEMLARAGVGFLRIVDRDLVELTNLQRQVLFDESDAARELPKSVAAARRLKSINSTIEIDPIIADANPSNIESLAGIGKQPVDLILDGADNVATRYLLNDLAVKYNIPWLYAACVGVTGRLMTIRPTQTACLCCLFPEPPPAAELPTCDTAGILGPAAAAVAAFQAAAAIRVLLDPSYKPGLLSLDLWQGELRSLASAAEPQKNCTCCAQRQFPYLAAVTDTFTATLCGRKAVQVQPSARGLHLDMPTAAQRLQAAGAVQQSNWFVRCQLRDPANVDLTLFPDGRLLVHGTTDPIRAKSIYARFIGS